MRKRWLQSVSRLSKSLPDARPIGIGRDLGPYRIDALLGTGVGIVYRGYHRELERAVAIKLVDRRRSNADSARWLLQEVRLAAALDHPGISGIHDVGYVGEESFIVMEHVDRDAADGVDSGQPGIRAGDGAALRAADYRCRRPRTGAACTAT